MAKPKFKGQKRTQIKKKQFLQAFQKSLINISQSCEQVDVSRQTVYEWLKDDEAFKTEFENLEDAVADILERRAITDALEGKDTLKVLEKLRPEKWGPKHEFDGGVTIEIVGLDEKRFSGETKN